MSKCDLNLNRSHISPVILLLYSFIIISFFWIAVPYANAGTVGCSDSSFCTVFTTSTVHTGDLEGLDGADRDL